MKLSKLQTQFVEAITTAELKTDAGILRSVVSTPSLSSQQRLEIYRNNYQLSMAAALAKIYPICEQIVGQDFFRTMAHHYRLQHRSRQPNVVNYTDAFPAFIAQYEAAKPLPYLADMALLEQAWFRAFTSPESPTLNLKALARLNELQYPNLIFEPKASLQLLTSDYPIDQIWQMHLATNLKHQSVNLSDGGCLLVIWRNENEVCLDTASHSEYTFLEACHSGLSLSDIQRQCPLVSLNQVLPKLVQRNYFSNYKLLGCTDAR